MRTLFRPQKYLDGLGRRRLGNDVLHSFGDFSILAILGVTDQIQHEQMYTATCTRLFIYIHVMANVKVRKHD